MNHPMVYILVVNNCTTQMIFEQLHHVRGRTRRRCASIRRADPALQGTECFCFDDTTHKAPLSTVATLSGTALESTELPLVPFPLYPAIDQRTLCHGLRIPNAAPLSCQAHEGALKGVGDTPTKTWGKVLRFRGVQPFAISSIDLFSMRWPQRFYMRKLTATFCSKYRA